MSAMGSWVLMTWGELASYLILAALAAGLVGLMVGFRAGVRNRPVPHVPADSRDYGATRRPVFENSHATASPDLLPQAADTTDGGHR